MLSKQKAIKSPPIYVPEELRILHVTPFYAPAYIYGGPTRSIPLLCKALARQGVNVTVFTTDANGSTRLDVPHDRPMISREGVKVWYYHKNIRGSYHYSRQLGQESVRQVENFDLIHSTGLWTHAILTAARAAKKGAIPHIISPRNNLTRWAYDYKPTKKRFYMSLGGERRRLNRASALHYTTELERTDSAHLNLTSPTFIVPNPVDLELFEVLPPRGFLRQKLGLNEDAFLFGMVGRIHPKKGCELAVQALASLAGEHENAHLVLIGPNENNYLSTVKLVAQQNGLGRRVHHVAQVEGAALVAAYTDLDCLLLPSYSESFGNVVVEAMAAGCPVLISDQVGVAPEVTEAEAGLVFPLKIEAIETAMRELINRADQGKELGKCGQLLAQQRFTPQSVAAATIEMYQQVLSARTKLPY
jgi:glycosyltransferase involved in cell wall biosynthesis